MGVAAIASEAPANSSDIPADAKDLLNAGSPWRWRIMLRKPVVTIESFKAAGIPSGQEVPLPPPGDDGGVESEPPPPGWRNVDFDDVSWTRSPAPVFGSRDEGRNSIALVTARSVFEVANPAAVKKLYLSLKYRGGVVVYLNGREVARAAMPDGEIKPETPGALYPEEAWLNTNGVALPAPVDWKLPQKERAAKRERSLGAVEIATGTLRAGLNVLAVESHRSAFHPSALTWWKFGQEHIYGRYRGWTPVGLTELRLSAVGTGVVVNTTGPGGLRVWNVDIHDRLEEVRSGAPESSLRPVRIVAARNGVFSGALGISSSSALKAPVVNVSDFVQETGAAKLPASVAQVWYVRLADVQSSQGGRPMRLFDLLDQQSPGEVAVEKNGSAVLPVRVEVRVPADAVTGAYKAIMTVAAAGMEPVPVQLRLDVLKWTLPVPQNFRTYAGIYQSPETLAEYYKIPAWSEKHWNVLEKSFALMAPFGNRIVNIPVVDRTQFGNDEGMVYWVRQADGSYGYDLSVLDRYLKLTKKYLGVPAFVALQIWHSGGWEARKANQENTVTVVDAATKERSHMQVPVFGTGESKAFWKPALDAIRGSLANEGMEKSMCLGILSDGTAPADVFRMFKEIVPDAGWTRGCHTATGERKPYPVGGGATVVCHEFCYGREVRDPEKDFPRFWAMTGPGISYLREDFDDTPAYMIRLTPERALYCGTRGFGRCILDGWTVAVDAGGRKRSCHLYNRWPSSSCAQREPTVMSLTHPGPDGALPSVRLHVLLEGLQEAEAAIVIGEAMNNQPEKLGPELVRRIRRELTERISLCRALCISRTLSGTQDGKGHIGSGADWQERSFRLYSLAGEVAVRTGKTVGQ